MSVAAAERLESVEAFSNRTEEPSLRTVAEKTAEMLPDGYRVEILGGSIVVSPTPSALHGTVVSRVHRQLVTRLPDDLECYQVVSIGEHGQNADYVTPDLAVMPVEAAEDHWLIHPEAFCFVMEVVSRSNAETDIKLKPQVYAGMEIPLFLLVDPRDGSIVLHSNPREGAYQAISRMKFGDTVVLPAPLKDVEIETEGLPRYGG
ncbi:Uma2 family endonuclease [Nocardiopsis potens]|uniref:Uma2 family endonuclease n=1 Tax=Nocardiopsis potens TaxID=1246458 RepID=UPI0003462FB2|nr:Uma2 family endonuclease [Nocardiopsis potens]